MIRHLKKACLTFIRDDGAATAVEYAVMLALIVATCIGGVGMLATSTGNSFTNTSDAIASAFN